MTTIPINRSPPAVAVLGAAGHTGRFVVAELGRRGLTPIALGRDDRQLTAAGFHGRGIECRAAAIEDAAALDRALAGTAAVINCAGPFLDTADAVVKAALRAGIHYLDLAAEQASAQATLEQFEVAARERGVAVVPAMAFFGGLADLLVAAAMGNWDFADDIKIGIALDSWLPTEGTRKTGARNTFPRFVITDGQLRALVQPAAEREWDFPAPFGQQAVTEVPFSEVPLIAKRLRPRELHTWLNALALRDIRNPATPPPEASDESGRSAQRFLVDVRVKKGGEQRRMAARGQDIYAFSAPLVCAGVERILSGDIRDVSAHPPAAIFDAVALLEALTPVFLRLEVATT